METLQQIRPRLIEPGVKYFLSSTLVQCNNIKYKYYNFIYNLGLFIGLISIISIFLYYKYTQKNNKKVQEEKRRTEQEYIMNKLRFIQDYRKDQVSNLLTDLPTFQNNPEVQLFNRKIYS
jgi:uncharacterized transporter YbjL